MNESFSKNYRRNELLTCSPIKLVVILYDMAISKIDLAIQNMNFETYDVVNESLQKVIEIIAELQTSLDMEKGGEISENLNQIYLYLNQKVLEGNIKKEKEPLIEAQKLLKELRESWNTLSKQNPSITSKKNSNAPKNPALGLNLKG